MSLLAGPCPGSKVKTLIGLVLGAFFYLTATGQTQEVLPIEKPLVFDQAAKNVWAKTALRAQKTKTGIRIIGPNGVEYNDAALWEVSLDEPLQPGRRILSFDIKTGSDHRPLWGKALLQFLVNGEEAEAATLKSSVPSFVKQIAEDKRGFIPFGTKRAQVLIPNDNNHLRAISFMTAGAANLDLTLSNFKLSIWPNRQEDKEAIEVVDLNIASQQKTVVQLRDAAWSAFYWFDNTPHGPYGDAHKQDETAWLFSDPKKLIDVRGGWFDAGDYGKYTVNGAYSTSMMMLTGLLAPNALDHAIKPLANHSESQADWIDLVEVELNWLLKMQRANGAVYHKAATQKFPSLETSPQNDADIKFVMPVSSTATAGFSATMFLASKMFGSIPEKHRKANVFLSAARKAEQWLAENQKLVMIDAQYDGHSYGGDYSDGNDEDERFFALAAKAASSRSKADIDAAFKLVFSRASHLFDTQYETGWQSVDLLGFWALKSLGDKLTTEQNNLVDTTLGLATQHWLKVKSRAQWNTAHDATKPLPWGSNGKLAFIGWHWSLWNSLEKDDAANSAARDQLDWFLGRNPLKQSFVTGTALSENTKPVLQPHFRPFTSDAIALPNGLLVGGPNSKELKGDPAASKLLGRPALEIYVDDAASYATNEVAINWQTAWALYLSLLTTQ